MDLTEKTENPWRHPWEVSRSGCLLKLLQSNGEEASYADIGAGDRYFSRKLRAITRGRVFAIDNEYQSPSPAEAGVTCLNDISLLDDGSIDCLVMMDVLEHVEDQAGFLKTVLGKLKDNGKIVLTVPALQQLFSSHDVFLKHHRRYGRKKLMDLLGENGIRAEQSHYFYTVLLVPRLVDLALEKAFPGKKRKNTGIGMWRHDENSCLTRFLVMVLNADFLLHRLLNLIKVRLPGLSLLAVCVKKQTPGQLPSAPRLGGLKSQG